MDKDQKTKEKMCAFYASDYHFEMMSLPYIENKISSTKIIIFTQNNLEKTIKTLLEKVNLKKEKKEKILQINWSNNDVDKFKDIEEINKNKEDVIIFVKGSQNYIKNINENIERWIKKECNLKIINCYNIEETGEYTEKIMENYKKMLNTSGEKAI